MEVIMTDLLVPLDGSKRAELAIPWAVRLAETTGDRIVLLRVRPAAGETPDPAPNETGYLADCAAALQQSNNFAVEIRPLSGPPAATIAEAAARPDVRLIVMATHGRTGSARVVLGSVVSQVLRESPVPVLLVPANGAVVPGYRRLIVPLDGSELAYAVLGPAEQFARATGAELILAQVVRHPGIVLDGAGHIEHQVAARLTEPVQLAGDYLQPIVNRLSERGVPARSVVLIGDPAGRLIDLARREAADAIVLATHGRSGLDRLQHGSVAEAIVRGAPIPVMTVGRAALRRQRGDVAAILQPTAPFD